MDAGEADIGVTLLTRRAVGLATRAQFFCSLPQTVSTSVQSLNFGYDVWRLCPTFGCADDDGGRKSKTTRVAESWPEAADILSSGLLPLPRLSPPPHPPPTPRTRSITLPVHPFETPIPLPIDRYHSVLFCSPVMLSVYCFIDAWSIQITFFPHAPLL